MVYILRRLFVNVSIGTDKVKDARAAIKKKDLALKKCSYRKQSLAVSLALRIFMLMRFSS